MITLATVVPPVSGHKKTTPSDVERSLASQADDQRHLLSGFGGGPKMRRATLLREMRRSAIRGVVA